MYLEVSYDGVALAAQEDEVSIGVVEREHHSVGGVYLHGDDGFAQSVRRSKGVLPFRHSAKPVGTNVMLIKCTLKHIS